MEKREKTIRVKNRIELRSLIETSIGTKESDKFLNVHSNGKWEISEVNTMENNYQCTIGSLASDTDKYKDTNFDKRLTKALKALDQKVTNYFNQR